MGFGFARVRIKGIRISEGLLYQKHVLQVNSNRIDINFARGSDLILEKVLLLLL